MAAIDGIKIVAGKSTFPEANQYRAPAICPRGRESSERLDIEPFIYTLD